MLKKLCVAEGRLLTQAGAVLLLQKLLLESKQGISFINKKGARLLSASVHPAEQCGVGAGDPSAWKQLVAVLQVSPSECTSVRA